MALRWETVDDGSRLGYDDSGRHVAQVHQRWMHAERRWVWEARYWGHTPPRATGPSPGSVPSTLGHFWTADEAVAAVEIRAGEPR